MTAAADLTPETTVDQPGDAETTVDSVDLESTVDQSGAADTASDEAPAPADETDESSADVEQPHDAEAPPALPDVAEAPAAENIEAEPDAVATSVGDASFADEVADAAEPAADAETPDTAAEAADAETPDTEAEAADAADTETPDTEAEAADAAEPVADAEPADTEPADTEPADTDAEATAADQAAAESTAPAPGPAPVPRSAVPTPPRGRVTPTGDEPSADARGTGEPWGRVDDDGTVSVREADGWRVVGQYPDGSPEEALAYFERKYADLAGEVGLLEVRHHRGGASAADLRSAARTVNAKLEGAAAVGDLASLVARVAALTESLTAASQTEAAAAREAVDDAVRTRTELVEKVEAIAARDPRSVQWKQASTEVSALFDQWQSQQQNGPRLPKSTAQLLWKRFRDARATFDKHRREFYAELDEAHKGVRDRKTRLVEKAEALSSKGEDGIPAYRDLLDEWKTAGRAGKKVDDALWARFKAAGDALYAARIDRETADAEASREKIEAKRALLEEARTVADERSVAKARTLLTGIQRNWDEIGRIFPREAERALDDDLRKIEQGLRTREEADWKRNNPETKARANDMTRQLTEAIEKLEDELAAAQKSGDKAAIAKAAEALDARRSWLTALGG